MGYPVRLELTREGLLVKLANHYTTWGTLVESVWFGLVLWHINHCRLFNAESILYT